jgi:D-aminopeptidase
MKNFILFTYLIIFFIFSNSYAQEQERARDLGIIIGQFKTGKFNAITDVPSVRVGHETVKFSDGKLIPGKGPARTGVTVIIPADGDIWKSKINAGSFVLNGNGEATGLMWVEESGIIETPIALTNTLNIGKVQTALVKWMIKNNPLIGISDDTLTPIVFECDDSTLNDIQGMHVNEEHVFSAIKNAKSGQVEEGSVGAGTGMISYEFKGGIGTSSRVVPIKNNNYTIGVLVNSNHGRRNTLRILGHEIGKELYDVVPRAYQEGSIILIVATDAPLDSRQLKRLSKRVMLGLARTGAIAQHGSGDVALSFSTANRIPHYPDNPEYTIRVLSDFHIDPIFEAAVEATEEAVINSLLAAKDMVGRDSKKVYALPHDKLKEILKKYTK